MTVPTRPDLNTRLTAVLGPTNTGKTYLAVERMCAHSSGMIGFPLRLLAREVYERVVALKGADKVALITGEEKILPPDARYFLCTAESMPMERDVSFLALDEAQMGVDDERGHIFTDRLLRARGRDETMVLGSESLRPLITRLLPGAEIITRPRFSTLSFTAAKKLSRLPKRSAIVAFTAEDVYAIAEMLRRQRGGAAVVMGALSPRTRNAQVAMYQSGEVDYLVATDAIGMGLNMDIGHVAFGALSKFDGKRRRRLTIAEMAQIAGRAGRHHRDGTFGVVQTGETARAEFEADEVLAIEAHAFPPLTELKWRNPTLEFKSVDALIRSLEMRPHQFGLQRTDDTIDVSVLRYLATDKTITDKLTDRFLLQRLWAVCQLPDYQKTAVEQHSRLVARLFGHLSSGRMTIPNELIAAEVSRLDNVNGDIDTLSARISAIRTWTYVSHQADWLADPAHWAARTRDIEDRLSDAMHERLTQRFVDRRTSVLLRELKGTDTRDVQVHADGAVEVDGTGIGMLNGFDFSVDPAARHAEKRMVMAAAERTLVQEFGRRAKALAEDTASGFTLHVAGAAVPAIKWRDQLVAGLSAGRHMLAPRLVLARGPDALALADKARIAERLQAWLAAEIDRHLKPLVQLAALAAQNEESGGLTAAARGIAVQLVDGGGCLLRETVEDLIVTLTPQDRKILRSIGVRLGMVHVFVAALLKPEPTRWRMALLWLQKPTPQSWPDILWAGRVSCPVDRQVSRAIYDAAGYWPVGQKAVRVDMVDRLADAVRESGKKRAPFIPPENLVSMVGLSTDEFAGLMGALGYRRRVIAPVSVPVGAGNIVLEKKPADTIAFQWKGRMTRHTLPKKADKTPRLPLEALPVALRATSPFAALAALKAGR
jgi:ATP-dependent RNA helicase SUPV3L1/SUV3